MIEHRTALLYSASYAILQTRVCVCVCVCDGCVSLCVCVCVQACLCVCVMDVLCEGLLFAVLLLSRSYYYPGL